MIKVFRTLIISNLYSMILASSWVLMDLHRSQKGNQHFIRCLCSLTLLQVKKLPVNSFRGNENNGELSIRFKKGSHCNHWNEFHHLSYFWSFNEQHVVAAEHTSNYNDASTFKCSIRPILSPSKLDLADFGIIWHLSGIFKFKKSETEPTWSWQFWSAD